MTSRVDAEWGVGAGRIWTWQSEEVGGGSSLVSLWVPGGLDGLGQGGFVVVVGWVAG